MSPISHAFHKMIGRAFDELKLPDKRFVILKDRACDENGHDLPLFYLPEGKSSWKNFRLRGRKFTEVDSLILKNNVIKVIVEIEETNVKPNHLFGKFMAAAMSSFYIYKPGQNEEYICGMSDKVHFIQILDSTRYLERSQKYEQWKKVEDSIQKSTKMDLNSTFDYKLFFGKRAESDLEPELKQKLLEYMQNLLD